MIVKRHTLANALRVAAAQYNSDAFDSDCHPGEGQKRLAEGFRRQAKEAFTLADRIEQEATIRLED